MEHIVRSVRGPERRQGVCSAQMRSSAASFAEISPEVILGYGVGNSAFVRYETIIFLENRLDEIL